MERLTFDGNFCDISQCTSTPGGSFCEDGSCSARKVWERLKAYEDTGLELEEVLPKDKADEIALKLMRLADLESICNYTRLRELAEADKDGRLVVRPCKVGDTLFRVFAGEILEHKVRNMRYLAIQERWDIDTTPFCPYVESSIGKTIFLTHEEAERALMER